MDHLRETLEAKVIAPIFGRFEAAPSDASLPVVVLENRRRRAQTRLLDALVSRGTVKVSPQTKKKIRLLVREWASKAFDDGFRKVEEFEIESARERELVAAIESGDPERLRAEHEKRLRQRVVDDYGTIEIRGIQTAHRVLQHLAEVYVPLDLESLPESADPDGQQVLALGKRRVPVAEVLREHRRILIVGSPGSGKSTLVGYLATRAAAGHLAEELGENEKILPLVLVVRSLSQTALTPHRLAEHLGTDADLVENALVHGRSILFFDGIDEAPKDLREKLVASIAKLAEQYPQVRIVATSRPAGDPGEIEHRLPDLEPFHLAELTQEDVGVFVDKWCLAAETSVRKDRSTAEQEAKRAAADLRSRIARSRSVQQIATNPLLASILCTVHRFLGHTIPERRATLYEKCTDALLYEWDQAKFPEGTAIGRLDAEAKRRLLMGVARSLHEDHGAEMCREDVVRRFAEVLPLLDRSPAEAEQMVTEIRDRSGLLVERRPGYFAFSHLTFQEYLTALHFVRGNDNLEMLTDRWEDRWWYEVIVLAAGVSGSDAGRIAGDLLAKRGRIAVILAAQCAESAIEIPVDVRKRIEMALANLVPPDNIFDALELGKLGKIVAPLLIRSLLQTEGIQKANILLALAVTEYSPSIPAIAQCVSDRSSIGIPAALESPAKTVGEFAILVLAGMANTSDTARRALSEALREPHRREFLQDLSSLSRRRRDGEDVIKMVDDALKAARQDKQRSRRAANTG